MQGTGDTTKHWVALPTGSLTARFFISYRSHDAAVAGSIEDRLEEGGQIVWRDRSVLRSGDLWRDEIRAGLTACDDVIVLLSHAAAESAEVRDEISIARELDKRIHVFAAFEVIGHPVYELIRDINIIRIDAWAPDADQATLRSLAETVTDHVLHPQIADQPLEPREFERVFSHRMTPPPDSPDLSSTLAYRYAGYADRSTSKTPMLLLNFALLFLQIGETDRAIAVLRDLAAGPAAALANYFLSLALIGGKRPAHVSPRVLDEAIKAAETAARSCRSPLIVTQLTILYLDSGRKHGPNVAALLKEALIALAEIAEEPAEVARYLQLSSLSGRNQLALPFKQDEVTGFLSHYAGGR